MRRFARFARFVRSQRGGALMHEFAPCDVAQFVVFVLFIAVLVVRCCRSHRLLLFHSLLSVIRVIRRRLVVVVIVIVVVLVVFVCVVFIIVVVLGQNIIIVEFEDLDFGGKRQLCQVPVFSVWFLELLAHHGAIRPAHVGINVAEIARVDPLHIGLFARQCVAHFAVHHIGRQRTEQQVELDIVGVVLAFSIWSTPQRPRIVKDVRLELLAYVGCLELLQHRVVDEPL
mmetsp:Transcript_51779/g.82587  ORF Transcript_51779/g.82587 Transcript_51779/m.82587 type:complete len:228 (-) Transcript_51779:605-1288(-)